jgi:hypothetical protein
MSRPTIALRVPAALVLLVAACELAEVTVATPRDIIIAEVVLRPGAAWQTAYLHRTTSDFGSARVFNATVVVREQGADGEIVFHTAEDSLCLTHAPLPPPPHTGSCYVARGADLVRPGGRYTLQVALADGRRLSGSTSVPEDFEIVKPATGSDGIARCRLPPGSATRLTWRRAEGAWVYIGETRLHGLVDALRTAGVQVPPREEDHIDLLGLSIGAADTSLVFPGEFGLFDRFDDALHPVLLAIRDGLPPGVTAEIAIAAADRNYVNWVRGGNFNPSGAVRLPSVSGDGTGVFGSVVIRRVVLDPTLPETAAACGQGND